jgi:alanyl-tRNA synthetase
MTIHEIRTRYIAFLQKKQHAEIPSASLVPQNDPTTLFVGSGMQPLVPYLLGKEHPSGARLVNSQKSFRAEDIEEVGDNRHTTFFEMLGNWSLGDYFKEEQLSFFFSFLTEEIGLDPAKLFVTVFIGDEKNGIPRDDESVEIWKRLFGTRGVDAHVVEVGSEEDGGRLGMRGGRIFYYNAKKNWWSRAGVPENMPPGEPGGPDSEVFYDFGTPHDPKFGAECHPNCDCGRFMEIGNSVFMQYLKKEDGSFALLPKQNVDFGGGLERIAAAAQNNSDVFMIDVFASVINLLERFSGKQYADSRYTRSFRIIADHVRAATFLLGDGVRPGNMDRGYVVRRLLRRAALHAMKLSLGDKDKEDSMLVRGAIITMEKYGNAYPELRGEEVYKTIVDAVWNEEIAFAHALERGVREFEKVASGGSISGEVALDLLATHGLPFELLLELALERGVAVDKEGFTRAMEKHREVSRAGLDQKFRGGLADTSEKTTRLHTAHHLLLRALQEVLGKGVKQRGSNITQERLRIDFSYGEKITKEQLALVQNIVNEKIAEALPVVRSVLPREEAERLGAEREFGAKYPDMVSVYSVGPKDATEENPQFDTAFSIEFCGGPHVSNTAELGSSGAFVIQKEEASSAGVRRIKATLAS